MESKTNTSYHNSSLLLKIIFWLTLVALGFVLFHFTLMLLNYQAATWVTEIYFDLQCGLPFFLFLTGTFIHNKKLRIPLLLFFPAFFIGYVLNVLNRYEFISVYHLQYLMGPALLGLFVIYCIHFFQKNKKTLLDFLKIIWLLCITWAFLVPRFTSGFYAGKFLIASMIIFPFLMGIGLYKYYRKTN